MRTDQLWAPTFFFVSLPPRTGELAATSEIFINASRKGKSLRIFVTGLSTFGRLRGGNQLKKVNQTKTAVSQTTTTATTTKEKTDKYSEAVSPPFDLMYRLKSSV